MRGNREEAGVASIDSGSQAGRSPVVDFEKLKTLGRELLVAIGEDPDREGLVETPERWAKMWREFVMHDPGKLETRFEKVQVDQMVAVTGIKVWSLCEHHLVPFSCHMTAAYITTDRVIGLSKVARLCEQAAHRLQLQERLVSEVADELQRITGSESVGVIGTGQHLCMVMRGVKAVDASAVTSVVRGLFMHSQAARAELLSLHTSGC